MIYDMAFRMPNPVHGIHFMVFHQTTVCKRPFGWNWWTKENGVKPVWGSSIPLRSDDETGLYLALSRCHTHVQLLYTLYACWPVDKLMVALRTLYSKNHGKNTCASRKHPDPAVTKSCFLWLCNGYNARSQWARIDRQIKYHFVGVLALPLAMLAKQVKAFI